MKMFRNAEAKKATADKSIASTGEGAPVSLTPDQLEIVAAGFVPGARGPIITSGGISVGPIATSEARS